MSPNGDEDVPQLQLRPEELSGKIWVGLKDEKDKQLEPVEAYVEQDLSPKLRALLAQPVQSAEERRFIRTKKLVREQLDVNGDFTKDDDSRFLENVKQRDRTLSGFDLYVSVGYQRALEALTTSKYHDFVHPRMVRASVAEDPLDEERPIKLYLCWLASAETATRVYVDDRHGVKLGECRLAPSFTSRVFLQFGSVVVTPSPGGGDLKQVQLPRESLKKELWIGLLENDGRKSKPVKAFVDEELLKPK